MIAERTFGFSDIRLNFSAEDKLGFGDQAQTTFERIFDCFDFSVGEKRGEHQFGNVFRQRCNRRQNHCRRAADIDIHRQEPRCICSASK